VLLVLHRLLLPDVDLLIDWGRFVAKPVVVLTLARSCACSVVSTMTCALWLWMSCFGVEELCIGGAENSASRHRYYLSLGVFKNIKIKFVGDKQ